MVLDKLKKRILIFLVVPVLAALLFFINDPFLKVATIVLIVIYVGFIIFLRDSVRSEEEPAAAPNLEIDPPSYEPDLGESIKIVSSNKNLEVITAENYIPEINVGKKNFFKPPDLKENFEKIANESLPKGIGQDEQFSFLLEKILSVVKDAFLANTAVFFWYNKRKEKLTLEKYVSECTDITERKFDLEDDILSKIVQKEEPELLTDINVTAEADVIRYYSVPQGIKSFVGVPLYYQNMLAGILALDSKESDAFGIETIYSLGRYVRIISFIIALFDEKHKDSLAERKLSGLLGLLSGDRFFQNEDELYNSLENALKNLISWDAFTFVYYNPLEQKFKTSKIVNNTSLKYIGENLEVELNGTLVGKCIVNGMPVKIDDTSASSFIRFSKSEDVSFDGSFLSIPLVYDNQNYGVLCFESLKKNAYTNADVHFMKSTVKILAFIVYSFSTQAVLKKLLSVDIETKTLNKDAFVERLTSDLYKANMLNVPGAVVMIYIDDFLEQESLFEGNPFPKVLRTVAKTISEEMTPTNLMGRISERIFGVYFFNTPTKDVFLWAEKLRVKIARKPVAVISKQTTFTVSIGLASTQNKTNAEEVLNNAELALKKALEKGGNAVRNIN
ncbi:MAG: GAF domain-containing protein [Bacteroidota bacterium]|nr:GAF domain-containing protein [Bacteroidota bacterium]MDP4190645.1 GAF domain-containing protein [Bacteroidota bacterium]MDP4194043.1 GAF domain-containing protein [Bacteroidota bacterium]